MKDKNLVEKYDDNPGAYFSMLVESLDNPVDVETIKSVIKGIKNNLGIDEYEIRRESKDSDTIRFRYDGKIYFAYPYSSNQVDIFDGNNNKLADKVFIDNIKETVFTESLKEDKFVPQDKMSKKAQKELNDKKRGTWGNTNPVTKVQPNKKAYDRKRDKKVVDEALTEDSDIFKDMSNALDDIEHLCNDTYNWDTDEWNDKENVKRTAERIIESAQVLLDSIKKY